MRSSSRDRLRSLLHRRAAVLQDAAIERGEVSGEEIEALERLDRLVGLCERLAVSRLQQWPLILVALVTLVTVSVLLFARVGSCEVELDLRVSEVRFEMASAQVLNEILNLSELGVAGLEEMVLPRARGRKAMAVEARKGTDLAVELSLPAAREESGGSITLVPTPLPAGTRVAFSSKAVPQRYRLSVASDGLALEAAIDGLVQAAIPGTGPVRLDVASPRPIRLHPRNGEVELDLTFAAPPQRVFSPQLTVADLAFLRVEEFQDGGRTLPRHVSTILGGTLYLESLNGLERPIRPGEALRFAASSGELRTLRLIDEHLSLRFHGRVRGMTIGTQASPRSLMPTYLEWLRARHRLALFWTTAVWLFGLLQAGLHWWRRR